MSLDTPGTLRFSLNTTYGSNFEGGHESTTGIDPMGSLVPVPLHRHEVSVDFVRFELVGAYTFAERWDAVVRLPYDIKDRDARVRLIDPATPDEVLAIEAGNDIHHRTARLTGFGDATLLAARRWYDTIAADDTLSVSFGTTLPIGETVEDPLVLGDLGLEHEHVQFGSGTFDPVLELAWSAPIAERLRIGWSGSIHTSLYENSSGYRGPTEGSTSLRLDFAATPDTVLRAGLVLHAQGYAEWNGRRDDNSGLIATGALL